MLTIGMKTIARRFRMIQELSGLKLMLLSLEFQSNDTQYIENHEIILRNYQLSISEVYIGAMYNTQSIKYIRMVLIG